MPNGRITVAPNIARDKMVLSVVIDGGDPISAVLAAPKVDELIEKIGFARAAMNDRSISEQSPMTVLEFTVVNPEWRASADIALGGNQADSVAIALRHSGYGWLSFVLPDKEANALGRWLVENTDTE